MSFGLSAAAVGLIGVAGSVASGYLASKAQKKQADIQAKAIKEGGQLDQAARKKAISQVLEIFGPSLVQFNDSMQSSIDLFNQGRVSTGDLLTQSAQNVSQISQQGGQSALNAMLGLPSPQAVSTADQAIGPIEPQQQPLQQVGPPPQQIGSPQAVTEPGQAPTQLNVQPDGTVRPGNQQGFNYPTQVGPAPQESPTPQQGLTAQGMAQLERKWGIGKSMSMNDIGASIAGPQPAQTTAFQPQAPLEGEFIPRDNNFQQQSVTMPEGTGTGFFGAQEAITTGADLGKENLIKGATGALGSLGAQTGIARDDITGGKNFALNQIQQAIQAGIGGTQAGIGAINQGVDRAVGFLNPYMSAGKEALNPYMALSGARGQEVFDAARINDPAYNLALQESERALGRNAAVTGGIGSGNTKGRFQLNAQQQAAADIDRQLGRYLPIIGGGQQAAGQAGGFAAQGGFQAGQMAQRGGEGESALLSRMGDVGIQSSQQLAQLAQQLGISEAQVLQTLGGNLSNIDVGTGQNIGKLRETTGINAANILQGTTNQQMGIEQNLSQNLANLDQETLNNIINSIQSGAGTTLQSQQQLAQLLANINIGSGTSAQQTAINLGQAKAGGVTNPIGNAINTGIGLYASGAFSQPQVAQSQPYTPIPDANLNLSQIPAPINPYS